MMGSARTVGGMDVTLRIATSDDDLLEAARVDLGSFGLPFARGRGARAALRRSLGWRRTTTTYLAERDGAAVGTACTYYMELTTPGGAPVPVLGIGDVGVLPGHRGTGVFRSLIEEILAAVHESGRVAAVLHAAESTIYGRFGFGPATRGRRVTLPAHRSNLRADVVVASGHQELLEPQDWMEVLPEVYRRGIGRRGGELSRSTEIWDKVLCSPGGDDGLLAGGVLEEPGESGLLALVHRGPGGEPAAYALYRIAESWQPEGPLHTMSVQEVVASDTASELAVWRALLSMDLVSAVETWLPVDAPLLAALEDRWAPSVSGEHDKLWVRLADPLRALASRHYRAQGDCVLEILGAAGEGQPLTLGLSVAAGGGHASVERSDRPAEITLGVAELAEVWLGGGSMQQLAALGRVVEQFPGAAGRLDALFGWSPLPWVTHDF